MRIECTGYRDTQTPRFCHETDLVVEKYQSQTADGTEATSALASVQSPAHGVVSSPVCSGAVGNESQTVEAYPTLSQSLPHSVGTSIDELALSFCWRYYGCSQDAIETSCTTDSQALLPDCIKALGLATCATIESSRDLSIKAKRYYLSALAKTNTALASPSRARSDSTLLSVMILSNIETIMGSNPQSFEAWTAHISGSTALLKVRGDAQLRTAAGRLLFMQASTNVVSECMRMTTRVPIYLHTLTDTAASYMSIESPDYVIWAIHRARLVLADLCSDVVAKRPRESDAVVLEAIRLGEYLVEVFRHGPPNPSSLKVSGNDEADGLPNVQYCLLVRNFQVSQCWISMLVVRMILHLLISTLIRSASDTTSMDAQIQSSKPTLDALQCDILDTVAYQVRLAKGELGLTGTNSTLYRLFSAQAGVSNAVSAMADHLLVESLCRSKLLTLPQEPPVFRLSRGYNVISPLLLVGQVAGPGSPLRRSACRLLRSAGESMAIQQAFILADQLEAACALSDSSGSGRS